MQKGDGSALRVPRLVLALARRRNLLHTRCQFKGSSVRGNDVLYAQPVDHSRSLSHTCQTNLAEILGALHPLPSSSRVDPPPSKPAPSRPPLASPLHHLAASLPHCLLLLPFSARYSVPLRRAVPSFVNEAALRRQIQHDGPSRSATVVSITGCQGHRIGPSSDSTDMCLTKYLRIRSLPAVLCREA